MAVDAVRETSWQREDFWDPVHFATAGSDKLARLLADRLASLLREKEADDIVVIGGGIVPNDDSLKLKKDGIKAVFTPGTPLEETVNWVSENVQPR